MFYQTKVKSIFPGGIVDERNKRLVFAGNKLAHVGDLVWTDGSVVLGHTPIRGGGAFFDSSISGVPVIGGPGKGYFDLQGNFHRAKLPVSGHFVNDDKYYCEVPKDVYDNALDVEIAINNNKCVGYRSARSDKHSFSTPTGEYYSAHIEIYNNYGIENYYDPIDPIEDSLKSSYDEIAIKNEHIENGGNFSPILLSNVGKVFLDKNGNYYGLIYSNAFTELGIYEGNIYALRFARGTAVSSAYKMYTTMNNTLNNVLYTALAGPVRPRDITWREAVEFITQFVRPNTVDISADSLTLPLQDGYKVTFTEQVPIKYAEYADLSTYPDLITSRGNIFDSNSIYPFYTNNFVITDPNNEIAINVNFPTKTTIPFNIPIVKLSEGLYLFSCPNGMYLYDKKKGLKQVSTSPCSNFRLRKMKNVLHAKVIS